MYVPLGCSPWVVPFALGGHVFSKVTNLEEKVLLIGMYVCMYVCSLRLFPWIVPFALGGPCLFQGN